MIINGTLVRPAAENDMEVWLSTRPHPYTSGEASVVAAQILERHGDDIEHASELVDRLVRRLHKDGRIARSQGDETAPSWSVVS